MSDKVDRAPGSSVSVRAGECRKPSDANSDNCLLEPQHSLRRNSLWTMVGNTVYVVCQWGMLVALSKLGDAQTVGRFALALAVTAPVILFASLLLRNIQASDAKREYLFGHYFGLRIVTSLPAFFVILALAFGAYGSTGTAFVIVAVGMAKLAESIGDIFLGLLQQHEQMSRVAISKMMKGPLGLLAFGLGFYLVGELFWAVVGLTTAWAAVTLSYDIPCTVRALAAERALPPNSEPGGGLSLVRPLFQKQMLLRLSSAALPLGFCGLLVSLRTNIPRYFIEFHLGEQELGYFAALAYVMAAVNIVINALGETALPRLGRYYSERDARAFANLLIKLLIVGAVVGLAGVAVAAVAGKEILSLVYRPEYGDYSRLFVVIMMAAAVCCVGSFTNYAMTAARQITVQAPLNLLVVAVMLGACMLLVPARGLFGAAEALMIGMLVHAAGGLGISYHAISSLRKEAQSD